MPYLITYLIKFISKESHVRAVITNLLYAQYNNSSFLSQLLINSSYKIYEITALIIFFGWDECLSTFLSKIIFFRFTQLRAKYKFDISNFLVYLFYLVLIAKNNACIFLHLNHNHNFDALSQSYR